MHRVEISGNLDSAMFASPDMTINEAADAMERHHARATVIGEGATPLGFLSEEDIVTKVLAVGLDPSRVHVRDIMVHGRIDQRGSFIVDDDLLGHSSIFAAETLHSRDDDDAQVLTEVLTGKCEECGVYSEEILEHEGLLMCADCSGFRSALFG